MGSLTRIGNIESLYNSIDKYRQKLKTDESVKEEKNRKIISKENESDDFSISPERESALFVYKSLDVFESAISSSFRDSNGDEFVGLRKNFRITFEEIWEKNMELPPVKEEKDIISNESELGEFGSEKVSGHISEFVKQLYDYVSSKESQSSGKNISSDDFRNWVVSSIEIGAEKAGKTLENMFSSDKNLAGIVEKTLEKTKKKIIDHFDDEIQLSKEDVAGKKVYSHVEIKKDYIGVSFD